MRKFAFYLVALTLLPELLSGNSTTQVQLLSGTGSDDTIDWEFKVSGGRRSGEWSRIAVPSNWEMKGFGTYRYYCDWQDDPAPDHTAWYRHAFTVPASWQGLQVEIVVGAAMTDTEVSINGQSAGPVHQGGFYEFRYDISALLRYGQENLLEATVHKYSADISVNRAERQADYWLFGGIYRPVWLEARPAQHIARMAIDARHTGNFSVDVMLGGVQDADRVTAQIETLAGGAVGAPFSVPVTRGAEQVRLETRAAGIQPWSAEWPNRYRVRVRLEHGSDTLHEVVETFGFRTVELRPGDGFYVNGEKVRLKGVNRHSSWPTSGRTLNKALSVQDVTLMKEMNMNAVRMSHYPPDRHFLDAADELGLYVIDELAGWQKAYATDPGRKLVREMLVRDVNHPSIVMWANGNEGGNNRDLVPVYAQFDPQRRLVIHPWQNFNGINTSHYEVYDGTTGWFFHGRDVFMPTEFLHGNYDGGAGAGLNDWWNLMLRSPLSAGGFLWAFADEGIVREDRGGAIDTALDSAPDGIVGPYREKEGSFFAIKKIWSPVFIEEGDLEMLPASFDGRLRVQNRYEFTNLNQVRFDWQLVDFPLPGTAGTAPTVRAAGSLVSPNAAPRDSAWLNLNLPAGWTQADGVRLTATDPHGREIYTWTWMTKHPADLVGRLVPGADGDAAGRTDGETIVLTARGVEARIATTTGQLVSVRRTDGSFSLTHGPRVIDGDAKLNSLTQAVDGHDYVVSATYEGNLRRVQWRMLPSGWLRLDYAYYFPPHAEKLYLGVTFDYPENLVTDLRWLGRGPYRVWKNRLAGMEYGVWEKRYNDTMTGAQWDYPEFKGFHANVHWAELGTKEGPLTLVFASDDIFLRVFTPAQPEPRGTQPRYTRVPFPEGDISFMHGIAPIGDRFHPAEANGPEGRLNLVPRHGRVFEGTVYLHFGKPEK